MIISYPFLKEDTPLDSNDDESSAALCYGGHYPVTTRMEWHNGVHFDGKTGSVCAIADGKVIYVCPPKAENKDPNDPQNYGELFVTKWTDNGLVILEHTAEIGADGQGKLIELTFYSTRTYALTEFLNCGFKCSSVLENA